MICQSLEISPTQEMAINKVWFDFHLKSLIVFVCWVVLNFENWDLFRAAKSRMITNCAAA